MRTATRIYVFMFVAAFVSACDSIGTSVGMSSEADTAAALDPDAYEYKGAADPLLSVSGADRAGGLAERFDAVQGRQ